MTPRIEMERKLMAKIMSNKCGDVIELEDGKCKFVYEIHETRLAPFLIGELFGAHSKRAIEWEDIAEVFNKNHKTKCGDGAV